MSVVATRPVVTGPISGGARGWPFGASSLDVAALGYTEAEYLLEGVATRYALGGIRLPQADAPLAQNSAIPLTDDIFALLGGSSHAFSREKVHTLYGDRSAFLEKFEAAAARAVAAGVLLPRDVAALVVEAAATWPQ